MTLIKINVIKVVIDNKNRVKEFRENHTWSIAELARRSGLAP